jgi:hypothetical protein
VPAGSGSGGSLGEAIGSLIGSYSRSGGARSSYSATGWHAQLVQLTGTRAGREALGDNVTVTSRTLLGWLAEEHTPRPSNRGAIQAAYDRLRGGFPESITGAKIEITGVVRTGDDVRERGTHGAPLRVDGSFGNWDRIRDLWESGDYDAADLEDAFIEDVVYEDPALGDGSGGWEFPGGGYTVSAS